ncbi:MAG TPA: amino acid adenylation domain-containing protein, partial [Pricia sp.]|nr:amino acid adenylation domain-containing protein [Pricia sp.]
FFNDTIVLRTEVDPESTFPDLVRAVKTTTLEAFSNKEVPFEFLVRELQQERSLSVNPFFQVMFLYYSVAEPENFGTDLQMEHEFYNPGVSKFDLTFDVAEKNGRLSFAFEYSTALFTAKTIERFKDHIALLVKGVVAFPQKSLSDIPMLTVEEMDFIVPEKNRPTDTFDAFTGIHQGIERMASTRPDAQAVSFRETTITYGQLDAKARAVAARILKTTEGRNEIVGLCVERSLEMIIGLLAILKAGCAYLPIDPKYPIGHVDYMMADADIKMLVTQQKLAPLFEKSKVDRLFLEDIEEDVKPSGSPSNLKMPTPKKSDLAYVIYTSGSTGRPKGVPITHGNILNATAGRLDFYPENPKVFLLLSSISFDSSKAGIFWTLCTGGNLIVTEDRIEQDLVKVGDTVQRNGVTHMLLLPTLYQLILEHVDAPKLKSLVTVMVAGEACPPTLADMHFTGLPDTALYNEYGPTEATVWCTAHKIGKQDRRDTVPLGRPVAKARIYLLDAARNLVPYGATGEIYVGGAGLSTGYLNRPELTVKAYFDDPFSENLGEKLYKTGDLARYNPDGELLFLGRSDQQVKIRGYRVELEEIEKAIRAAGRVGQVAVLAEGAGNGPKRIAAYLTASESIEIHTLKKSLENRLPNYMLPASITQVDMLPLLPNGKIDKVALMQKDKEVPSRNNVQRQAPKSELEQKLYNLWRDILKQDDIGVHDNFFALGGDSILSIQFIAKARKAGIRLTPNQIFDHQTIAALAGYIDTKEKEGDEWDYLVALRKAGSEKPLFCIHAGGGHVFFYNILTKYIGAHRPIYALQASGVYADRKMHHSIEAMAKDYLQAIRAVQPTGPYNIMVYCFSVAVGQEMLIQLTAADETANLIVMDTMTDPWKLDTSERLRMRIKSFAKRFRTNPVQTIQGMVGGRMTQLRLKLRKILAKGDDKILAQMNDNLAHICSQYAWRPHREKITLLLTEKPEGDFNKEVIGSWKKVALGGVKVVPVAGNHIDLFAEPEVEAVAKKIDANCV